MRQDDFDRAFILIRTSNNVHSFTNTITIPTKIEELCKIPRVKQEIIYSLKNLLKEIKCCGVNNENNLIGEKLKKS